MVDEEKKKLRRSFRALKKYKKLSLKVLNIFLRALEVLVLLGLALAISSYTGEGDNISNEIIQVLLFGILVSVISTFGFFYVSSQVALCLEKRIRTRKFPNQVPVLLFFVVLISGVVYFFLIYIATDLSEVISQFFLDECTGIGFEAPLGSYSLDVCLESRN